MDVAELVAYLGLAIDEETWNKGLELIEKTRAGVEKLSETKHEAGEKEKKEGNELKDVLEEGLESYFGYEGLKSIEELVEHTMEATIQAKHLGERLGITTEAVQSLGYAASVTGASSGTMTSALQRLSFNMQQAGQHGQHFHEQLSKLHLTYGELHKLPLDKQLEEIAEQFKKMPDGPEKVALAMQLFGRQAGPQLIPMLNEGKEGIAELREEAEKLGVTTGEENVEKAEKLERAQKQLQARWGAMKDALAFALIPTITTLTDVTSKAVDFLRDHEEILIAALTGIGAAIAYVGYQTAITHAEMLAAFAEFVVPIMVIALLIQTVVDTVEEGLTPFRAVVLVIGALAIAVGLVMGVLNPFVLIIGAIITGAILLVKHWDAVKSAIVDAWNYVVDLFENSSPAIQAAIFLAFLPISMTILAIKELIDHWQDLKDAVGGSLDSFGSPDEIAARMRTQNAERADAASDAASGGAGTGGEGVTKLEVHAPVTINANGDPATIHKHIKEHHERTTRDALHDLRKGG